MPAISGSAPGKVILFGEHAVVYGRPAIAVPITNVYARAVVMANPKLPHGKVYVQAPDIGLDAFVDDLPKDDPIAKVVQLTKEALKLERIQACTLRVTSTIPIASGMGSGAAVTIAITRAISQFVGIPLSDEKISALAFEVEKIHHGTPSGIDNTVIAFNTPVFFIKGQPIELLGLQAPLLLIIGDTGVPSPTKIAVGDVRKAWQASPKHLNMLFDRVGAITEQARDALISGDLTILGRLMDINHVLLQELDVSSPELDKLVASAKNAGALGAKLSGGGRGGNMIALVNKDVSDAVAEALREAGAVRTIITLVGGKI
jgi:mevalonate kinase